MSLKPKQIWTLTIVFSLAFLLLSSPVHAQPSRRPLADAWAQVSALGDSVLVRIGNLLLGVWQHGAAKEGTSIDPNGSPKPQAPPSGTTDEGVLIDPNGHP